MKNHNDYLKREADFQDTKVENKARKNMDDFYIDEASVYRFNFREELIGDIKNKSVLDLGCGKGNMSVSFLKKGAYVTSIDISPKSIEMVKEKAKELNLENNLTALVMDAHNLEFEDNSFDMVLADGILHHLPDMEQALKEIKRVLNHNGYVIMTEPLGMNLLLKLYRGITPKLRSSDERPFKMDELKLIKKIFPVSDFNFFDLTTIYSKIFIVLKLKKFANTLQKLFISIDKKLIMKKKKKITFLQKMSWVIIIKAYKD